jgi:hypothetical protein
MSFPRPKTVIYAVLALLLAIEVLWDSAPKRAGLTDEVEISAARRFPQTVSADDVIY